jgi:cytochrome c oxidase subunit 4
MNMSSVTDPTPLHSTDKPAEAHADHGHGHGEHWVHISDWQTLVKVWVALMVLTFLTVAATWVNLGSLNIWIAMGVAVAKASLVVLYFMHMKYNKPFLAYVFTFSLAFVAFFLAMVMLDSKNYQEAIEQRRLDDTEQTPIKQQVPTTPVNPGPAAPTPTK